MRVKRYLMDSEEITAGGRTRCVRVNKFHFGLVFDSNWL